jgi:hypothetical protein
LLAGFSMHRVVRERTVGQDDQRSGCSELWQSFAESSDRPDFDNSADVE